MTARLRSRIVGSLDKIGARSHPSYVSARLARWRRATDGPLLIVAIGSLALLLLEFRRSDLTLADRMLLDVVNVLVLAVFAID